MKRISTNENLESFLRQNAEEYRMRPSAKVWDGISDNLRKRKRRFYFGLLALLISSSILGYTFLELSFDTLADSSTVPNSDIKATGKRSNGETSLEKYNTKVDNTKGNSNTETNTRPTLLNSSTVLNEDNASSNKRIQRIIDPSASILKGNTEIQSQETVTDNLKESWSADLLTSSSNRETSNATNSLNNLISAKTSPDFSTLKAVPTAENSAVLPLKNKPGKFSMMFYFTPTVSYRKLSENKSYIRSVSSGSATFTNSQLQDINDAVTHKPNIGLELGLTSKYAVSKTVKLRAGLQFNISRYNMQASRHTPELATIALNNGPSGVQSVGTMSTYRNNIGNQTEWLENFYFQVSAPIGAEVKLTGNDKVYLGAASTIQPTYVLGDKAYLLTTDYKNYAQVPWLMRRGNVNTNLETFVAYSTGKLKWQVGPQVRYQLLSSFANKYPVKENLFDFGLKVGISVNPNQ